MWYHWDSSVPKINEIPKISAEDTTLSTTNAQGETLVVPVPKGSMIGINVPGIHYNRKLILMFMFKDNDG